MQNKSPVHVIIAIATLAAAARGTELYVATTGSDANPGSREKPFATLERGRDAARQARGSSVILAAGTYRLSRSFTLDGRDSDTAYRGIGARITGSVAIPAGAVTPVTDPAVLSRLVPEVRGRVLEVDLRALGISDPGELGPRGFGRPYLPAPLELFVDEEPLRLAQWPKLGEPGLAIGRVIDPGQFRSDGRNPPRGGTFAFSDSRPARWAQAEDVWITGFFFNHDYEGRHAGS
jgi:hypothetical protein